MSTWLTRQQTRRTGSNNQGSDLDTQGQCCQIGPDSPPHLATLHRVWGEHGTWKWGLETHLASCRNSGSMTLTNSDGSMTSRISSSSLRNITSLGLWVLGQYLSRAVTACRETRAVESLEYGLDVWLWIWFGCMVMVWIWLGIGAPFQTKRVVFDCVNQPQQRNIYPYSVGNKI